MAAYTPQPPGGSGQRITKSTRSNNLFIDSHVSELKDEREDIQKKTFTKWINSYLTKRGKPEVVDLFGDFCNGKSLLALLESLDGVPLVPEKGKMRVHHLNNVSKAVRYLTDKCNIRLVNISSDDVVNGSAKLILGLVWSIILHWQVKRAMAASEPTSESSHDGFEKRLLEWCQTSTQGYKKVNIHNFTTSWSDGFAFNALIHSHRPHLFDYDELTVINDVEYTLLHAFQIAHSNLHIARLLDPEDMVRPDKKSVLVYLTCLYEALTDDSTNQETEDVSSTNQKLPTQDTCNAQSNQSTFNQTGNQIIDPVTTTNQMPALETPDNLADTHEATTTSIPITSALQKTKANPQAESPQVPAKVAKLSHRNQPTQSNTPELAFVPDTQSDVTSVTSVSGLSSLTDIASFNSALESTLTWLQEAKDRFNRMKPVAEDVEIVKDQFQEHEKYMMELTQYQSNVGGLLNKGNTLLLAGDLNVEQEKEVRNQVEFLNQEWEELRVGAMERQTSLQQSLMDLQLEQLNELAAWLTDMESKIENFTCNVDTLENIRVCVEEHQKLQDSLEKQQGRVASLQNMVVIVEDGVQDPVIHNKSAYQSMERMLEDLGTRWTAVCQWVEDKWMHLQDVDIKWRSYHSNADKFNKWLDEQEMLLGRMKLSDISDPAILLSQVQRLKTIEADMDNQMSRYDELTSAGQALISYLPSFPQTAEKIQLRLDEYKQRWDHVVEMMEEQGRVIAESGIDPEAVLAATSRYQQGIIDEYETLESKVSTWLDKSESTFQLLESDDSGLSIEEQSVLLKDTCEEAVEIRSAVERIKILVRQEEKELGEKRVKLGSVLCEKWSRVNSRLEGLIDTVGLKVQHKQASSELASLQAILSGYQSWINNVPDEDSLDTTEMGRLGEQCRVKVKAMRQQQERVDQLYASRHSKCAMADSQLQSSISSLNSDWTDVLNLIESKLDSLSHQLTQSPPKKYLEAKDALMKWLSEVEEVLEERVYISDIRTMEKKINLYQDLQKAISEHVADVEYVNKTGKDLVRNMVTPTDTSSSLKVQLSSLNSRWQQVSQNIQEKLAFLAQGIDKLKQFEGQVNGLTRWMADMEHFLEVEQPVVGDTETLQAQISQSDGALSDIDTLQSVVDEINESSDSLVAGSEPEFGVELTREMERMNERWAEINKMSQDQNKLLKEALAKSSSLVENITSLNSFLTEFDAQISEKLVFTTKADLDTSCEKVKRLEGELENRKPQLQLIQKVSTDLMERSRQDSLPRLLNRLRHIDHKWKLVTDRLLTKQEECSDVSTQYSDFLSIVQSEEMYIRQLEDKLVTGDDEAVDAEDMAAEMDELENLLEERDKLSSAALDDLSTKFQQTNILTEETSLVKSQLDSRLAEVVEKVRERLQVLDRTSQRSQDTELRLSQMETWMNEVNSLFREWNDQDLLAGELPDDYKMLSEEFAEKDQFLQSISTQIKDLRVLGKTLAAERLEKKLDMIKEDYSICQQNFLKWQRPVDFDPKLRRAQQQLHEIDDKIYLIEIFSEDPEHVGIRLEQCTKFYGIMSEMKTEVEYVIKTGRQLVEKKQVDFPRRVNQTLDALKSLYNRLGSQISQARKDLDKALKISKVIAKHVTKVTSLVESTEARLFKDIVNLEEEALWVEEREKELETVHTTLTAITTLYEQFQQYAEDTALEEARENLDSLKERWQNVIQGLATRLRSIQAQKSNTDAEFEVLSVRSRKLLADLEPLKSLLDNPTNIELTDRMEGLEGLMQKLQAELVSLKEEVTTLNTSAVDISSKGNNYRDQITPIISSVNSTYEQLSCSTQLNNDEVVKASVATFLSEPAGGATTQMDTDTESSTETVRVFLELKEHLSRTCSPYEVASLFAKCEVMESELPTHEKDEFTSLLAEWNGRRNSTVARWQNYQLSWTRMSLKLKELEDKLDMAQTQSDLLKEIEDEIARRQVDINALNEQAEELTEHDTPPIDQQLLQLNQKWVGIRSRVANFKPTNGMAPHTNGTAQLSPPTKQKYEYAVINKNRKNGAELVVSPEIAFSVESERVVTKREMNLSLESPSTPINNNVLFVTSPSTETSGTSPSKSLTPGSGIDVDDASISLEDMTASTSSKRSIVVTDLDEAAKTASRDSLQQGLSADSEEGVEMVRRLTSRVGILQQQLKSSGIEVDQYTHENFSSSQHILKSVRVSMEVLEEDIKQTEARLKAQSLYSSSAVNEILDNLNDSWNLLNTSYKELQSNFDEALTLWTQFHNLLRVITTWLDNTEKVLKRGRDRSGELIISQAKEAQKDLEDGMSEHQAIVHSLARTAVPLAAKLIPSDAERITNKVATVTSRWRQLTLEIRGRKPSVYLQRLTSFPHWQAALDLAHRLDTMADSGKCLDVMDDLSFWLDETEIIISASPDYTDELSLRDTLEKVKDRREELPHKKEAVEFVARSSKDLWDLPGLKADDKEKLGRDMQRINRKWTMIKKSIEDRQRYLESCIENLEDLLFEIGKLNEELWQAIEDLEPKMGPESFSNIKQTYPRNQAVTIETLNAWYREVLLLYKKHSAILPRNMEAHYRRLNIRWSALKERTQLNRAGSDSSIEETLATAVDAENIFEEPRHSVFMNDHMPIDSVPSVSTIQEEDCPPPPPRVESLQPGPLPQTSAGGSTSPPPAMMLNREETLALLRDRLATLNRTVSNKRVDVTDHSQISENQVKVAKLTVAVQEILRQLSMFPEADNQVSGLRTECTDCQARSLARGKELKQLLIDSHKYGNQMAHVDSWLSQLEDKINSRKMEALGDAVDVLDRQIEQHAALELEVKSWQDNYAILNKMTEHLLSTYPHEDTSNIKMNRESLSVRWSSVQMFLNEYGRTLNTHKQTLQDFDKTLNDFLLWITEQESLADILFEEVKDNHPMRSSTWQQRAKDLQSEIDAHQQTHELLSVTGKRMTAADDTQVMKKRLDDMNERWTQLRTKTVEIRSKLESSMQQWSELIKRCRVLIDYLMSRENELIAARPVAGNLPGVKEQQLVHEGWKNRLEGKTSEFEHTISTGRFYLEKEGADRRLSSASCDSRIIDELSVEGSEAKSVIKNIRRHIRLLNQKWMELHNKSERWQNQLEASEKTLQNINSLLSIATRHLNEIDNNTQAWKNVNDYPLSDLPRQLTTARALRRKNEEVGEVLNKSMTLVRSLDQSEGPVDMQTKQTISQLADRQQKAEQTLDDRVSQLVSLNRSLVPEVSDLLSDSVSKPYERATTPTGVPYYINHEKKTTQWDHPRMVSLLTQLPKYNATKFSAYRTAQKLRKMQKALCLNSIRLKDVIRTCQEHNVVSTVGEEIIDVNLMVTCLRDLFEHLADDRHAAGVNVPLSIDLSLNWLLNVYDLGRQGQLRSLSFQVGLVITSRGAVEDKFNYLLSCLADKSGQIDERKLSYLLSDCIQIPRQLGELSSFGGANIEPSVQSCLEQAKGSTTINCRQFMDWLALEPQSMVWLPVFHRLATSESCRHQAKCNLCKSTPIIGLRYRCLRCFNFNLCQNCFFSGKKGKNHKLNHPMKEYYCASTSNDEMKDLSSPMRKKYSSGRYIKKHNPKGYLPLSKLTDGDSTFSRESLSFMSDLGTPVSSPPSIHIQYDIGGSHSSHDAVQSHGTLQSHDIDSPGGDDPEIHRDIEKYANTLSKLERRNTNNGNSNTVKVTDYTSTGDEVDSRLPQGHMDLGTSTYIDSSYHADISVALPTTNGCSLPSDNNTSTSQRTGDNDEHKIIERYCSSLTTSPAHRPTELHKPEEITYTDSPLKSPMQIVMALEDSQKTELEAMIKDLEDENRNLQNEYQRLQAERDQQPAPRIMGSGDKEAEMLAEAKLLRQHKGRLESRMKILEDHNRQLESQLGRLKLLLEQPAGDPSSLELIQSSNTLTGTSHSPLRVKKLPPTYEKQLSVEHVEHSASKLTSMQRTPKLHGSIGELFQMAGQVGKAVGDLVSAVSDQPQSS